MMRWIKRELSRVGIAHIYEEDSIMEIQEIFKRSLYILIEYIEIHLCIAGCKRDGHLRRHIDAGSDIERSCDFLGHAIVRSIICTLNW